MEASQVAAYAVERVKLISRRLPSITVRTYSILPTYHTTPVLKRLPGRRSHGTSCLDHDP